MAYINVDEAYILDNTGLQVDQVVDLPYTDAGLTDTQKAQARANIAAGGSNRNLLDNAYFVGGGSQLGDGVFPINQRGQTSYSNSSYGIDRWVGNYTLNAGYLTVNGFMYQIASYPLGVPLTFSAMLEDGSVVGGTLTITETTTQEYFYTDGSTIQLVKASGGGALMVWTGSSVNVKAVKLEVGTVSTLANDAPPDFGEELRKCQHYLYAVTFPGYSYTGQICFALDATNINWVITTPTPMVQDKLPSITVTNSLYANGVAISNYAIVNYPYGNNVKVSAQAGGLTNGQLYPITTSANEAKVLISAEL